jgi:flagellar M-ring protein FliF
MAVAEDDIEATPKPVGFVDSPMGRTILLGAGIAAVLAVMTAVFLWYQQPEYRVLFANFTDRDGGAITASLDQMGIKHKFSDGGAAIMVPADQVHDARLRLAAQGLPKGGNVGFELMENQKLGVSQFLEQINYQRSLEGELAKSIQSLGVVSAARVHLALPKPQVFVRDQQKPTASVVVTMQAGRSLEAGQVSAIVHLVASSVPDLATSAVSVIDQNGNLLSDTSRQLGAKQLDPNQLKHVLQLQQSIIKQVESIVAPIVGNANVRAEATADVDFSQVDTAAESFKPNSPPAPSAIRSSQTSEATPAAPAVATGIPGALSNQPPGATTAPIVAPPGTPGAAATAAAGTGVPSRKDATTNYEVDKTLRIEQKPMGTIKRLSVGVLVNYKRIVDADNKVTVKALTAAEIKQINDLVKEAMGFSEARGDTLNVTNAPFDGVDKPVELPAKIEWWRDPENLALAREIGKFTLAAIVLSYLFFRILRPMLRPLFRKLDEINKVPPPPPAPVIKVEDVDAIIAKTQLEELEALQAKGYRENLQMAKNLAKEDPRIVAQVVKAWVGANE